MTRIAIVTDSSADLPTELVQRYGIHLVPQILIIDGERLEEGVDITSEEIYQAVEAGRDVRIGHPPPDDFRVVYKKMQKEIEGAVVVTLATTWNPTLVSAEVAGVTYRRLPTRVVNSRQVSMGVGFVSLAAAQAARRAHASLESVAESALEAVERVHTLFLPASIEFAYRAGYVPKAAHIVHAPLHHVPFLVVEKSYLHVEEYVHAGTPAWEHALAWARNRVGSRAVQVAVMHANAEASARAFAERVSEALNVTALYLTTLTPIVGLRTGPGTVGLALYET